MKNNETIKITVRAVISPRDRGLRVLMREYKVYKRLIIPRVVEAVRREIKKPYMNVYSQQKHMLPKKLWEYLKNLPYHPMPFHNQSVWLEKHNRTFKIHFKTKQGNGTAACNLIVPQKYRNLIEKACGKDNPILGQVELIEDRRYGWVNCHIVLRLPKPEPYEPKGWIGIDVGWNYLAVSAYVDNKGKIGHVTFHGKKWKTRIIQLKYLLKMFQRTGKSTKVWQHRLRNVTNYTIGVIAREIVRKAKKLKAGVAMEKLTFQSHTKKWLIPRYKLRRAIKNLCERNGIPFMEVPAKDTSITCNKCGYKNKSNRKGKIFKCKKCGYECNADFNAAVNIAKKAIEKYKKEKRKTAGKTAIPVSYTGTGKDSRAICTESRGKLQPPKARKPDDHPIDDIYKRVGKPSTIETEVENQATKTNTQQKPAEYLQVTTTETVNRELQHLLMFI